MHIEHGILSTSFGLALFLLLIYKIRSMVYTYLIPFLIEQKIALKKRYALIIEKKKMLVASTTRLENQIKAQDIEFAVLEKKIQTWYTHLRHEEALKQASFNIRIITLQTKRQQQQASLSATKLAQEIIPQTFGEAKEELSRRYHGEQGHILLSSFVSSLRKSL